MLQLVLEIVAAYLVLDLVQLIFNPLSAFLPVQIFSQRVGVSTGNGTSGRGKRTGGGSGGGSVRCIVPKLAGSSIGPMQLATAQTPNKVLRP